MNPKQLVKRLSLQIWDLTHLMRKMLFLLNADYEIRFCDYVQILSDLRADFE
jgi:hypothetical protein